MPRIYSNGPSKDFVRSCFDALALRSKRLYLASPYFTLAAPIIEAAESGKDVRLLVGLNPATTPEALKAVFGRPSVAIRYLTSRFHAKIFVFDEAALVGSANLTHNGFAQNREASIPFDIAEDRMIFEEAQTLFAELWGSARPLTKEVLDEFSAAFNSIVRATADIDALLEKRIGKVEPPNVRIESRQKSREAIFLDPLRQQIYEQYRPAFEEVRHVMMENGLRRDEFSSDDMSREINRFLNWVRLTQAPGEDAWRAEPLRQRADRLPRIAAFGEQWATTEDPKIGPTYFSRLAAVDRVFSTPEAIAAASKDDLSEGLSALHAFWEQLRFIRGGEAALVPEFWRRNEDRIDHVRVTLAHLLHGPGETLTRLHDICYDSRRKLANFGLFCALELYGSIKPEEIPPINGRIAKALRFLGFDVKG